MAKEKDEKVLNIYQRMNAVQKEVDYIQKGDKKVDNKYGFVSHDQVTAKMQPYLVRHGICVISSVEEYKNFDVEARRFNSRSNQYEDVLNLRTELILNVKFVNIDDPKDFIEVRTIGFGFDPSDKGAGKAVSYAFKYALLKNFLLETGDDPDEDQATEMKPKGKENIKAVDLKQQQREEEDKLPRMTDDHVSELIRLEASCHPSFITHSKAKLKEKYGSDDYYVLPDIHFASMKKAYLENTDMLAKLNVTEEKAV